MIYQFPDKQPNEIKKGLYFDFAGKLLTGETIADATVTGSVAGVMGNVQTVGTKIVWDATGGSNRDAVKITVVATGSLGSVIEANGIMLVKEVA